MNLKPNFLQALDENPDDINLRLVYADWLEEQGEDEEAARQRKFPAAKEWLVRLSAAVSDWGSVSYETLIEFGRQVFKHGAVDFLNAALGQALEANSQEFWKNWCIVTDLPLPPGLAERRFQSRYIPGHGTCEECGDTVYFFGEPLPAPEPTASHDTEDDDRPVRLDDDRLDRFDDDFYNERGW